MRLYYSPAHKPPFINWMYTQYTLFLKYSTVRHYTVKSLLISRVIGTFSRDGLGSFKVNTRGSWLGGAACTRRSVNDKKRSDFDSEARLSYLPKTWANKCENVTGTGKSNSYVRGWIDPANDFLWLRISVAMRSRPTRPNRMLFSRFIVWARSRSTERSDSWNTFMEVISHRRRLSSFPLKVHDLKDCYVTISTRFGGIYINSHWLLHCRDSLIRT